MSTRSSSGPASWSGRARWRSPASAIAPSPPPSRCRTCCATTARGCTWRWSNGPICAPTRPGGDFNFLEVGRAAFDLSDRGVTGRKQPGPIDAYLYTDRGIYRPGESVHLIGLVRDDQAAATAALPLTARLLRPDGVEVERR